MNHSSRRALVLAAAALAANSAFAQVQDEANVLREAAAHRDGLAFHRPGLDVGLYGLLDLTLSTANNKNTKGNRLTNFDTPWFSGSRWGIIGSPPPPAGGPPGAFSAEREVII